MFHSNFEEGDEACIVKKYIKTILLIRLCFSTYFCSLFLLFCDQSDLPDTVLCSGNNVF